MAAACSTKPPEEAGGQVTLKIAFWGDFGLDELKDAVRGGEPERQDRPQLGRVQRPARGPAEEADRRQRRAGHRRHRRGLHRPVPQPGRQVRQPARQGCRRVRGRSTWPGSGTSRCRPTARPRSASAPTSAAWPCATAPTCSRRPACPPSATPVSALWPTWDDVHRRPASSTSPADRQEVRRLRHQPVQPDPRPAAASASTTSRDSCRWTAARRSRSTSPSRRSTPACRPTWPASSRMERGLQQGRLRRAGLPGLDARPHPEHRARHQQGKWDIAAIPGGGGNWGGSFLTVPKQGKNVDEAYKFIEWMIQPEQQIDIFKKVGNLPSQPGAVQGPGDARLQERVLQQRAGRPDLRRDRGEPEAAVPRQEERPDPGRGRERHQLASRPGTLKPPTAWAKAVKEAEKAAQACADTYTPAAAGRRAAPRRRRRLA